MNHFKMILLLAAICLIAASAVADIYMWTDNDGVKHFTNYAPPDDAALIMKTKEEPYDEAADRARQAAEQQELLERERMEMAAREAELQLREAAAERRLAQAEREATEKLQEAEELLQSAGNNQSDYWGYGYYHSYYPRHPYYKKWYYRAGGGRYHKGLYPVPYSRDRYTHQNLYDRDGKYDFPQYRPKTYYRGTSRHLQQGIRPSLGAPRGGYQNTRTLGGIRSR